MDELSKTDAIDLAWMLAARLNEADPLEILAGQANALSGHAPVFKTAAKRLGTLHAQIKAGHSDKCRTLKRRDNGYLAPGWTRRSGWKCSPDCKANLPEGS